VTIFFQSTDFIGLDSKKAPVKTRAYLYLVAGVGFEPTTFRVGRSSTKTKG
jgi:hypothetical protein